MNNMKKLTLIALVGAAVVSSACHRQAPTVNTLSEFSSRELARATTLEDSVVAVSGSFVGGYFRFQADQASGNIDRAEMLRGIRDAFGVDTANTSYARGLQMGITALNVYKELAAGGEISKEEFLKTISAAFHLDSVTEQEARTLQSEFYRMSERMNQEAQKRREAKTYESQAARENRLLADAVAAKLQSQPEYQAVGNEGLLKKVVTAGDTATLGSTERVTVSYRISRIDSGQEIRNVKEARMFVGRPQNDVLASVMPYMTLGQSAEFFVPYQLAYGISGNERLEVGPCESVMISVTVSPAE